MSLIANVAVSTLRPQQQHQQQSTNAQQRDGKSFQSNKNYISKSYHTEATPPQATVSCLQQPSPSEPTNSIKTSLSNSPIAANFMGLSPLFSFESGVVLSGSSGCCSLSNSPSSSSSSNSYLPLQSMEKKVSVATGNQICVNSSTNLKDSFSSASCQFNASLLAAVNGELEKGHVIIKSSTDNLNQSETNLSVSESLQNHNHSTDKKKMRIVENVQHLTNSCNLNNEDARTLQLAVELTMMNFDQVPSPTLGLPSTLSPTQTSNHYQQIQSHRMQNSIVEQHQPHTSPSSYAPLANPYKMTTKVVLQSQSQTPTTLLNQKFLTESKQNNFPLSNPNQSLSTVAPTITEERSKKSQNMTECVPVPSSEHVAEIVGRQGCKIKALRAKTNTYIKTPVRNEEPVFVVTGRKEDVAKAKREILSAAEHFTLIRATRRTNDGMSTGSAVLASGGGSNSGHLVSSPKNLLSSATPLPGQITIQVRVPYRVVGLVVGPKGNTIKHIQHETQTYIVTPSRDKDPIFEVTGMANNVRMARKQIEAHIASRTGNSLVVQAPTPPPLPPMAPTASFNESLSPNQSSAFHSLNSLNKMLNDDLHSEILTSIYKSGIGSTLEYNQTDVLNSDNKCGTNSFNGFINREINQNMSSVNDLQCQVTINSGNTSNGSMPSNCNVFMNSILDANIGCNSATQFESSTNFSQVANNSNATENLKSVMNSINLVENSNCGASGVLHQQSNLAANVLFTRSCSSASSTASSSKSFNNNANSYNAQLWKTLNGGSSSNCIGNNDNLDVDEGIGESPLYSWGLPSTLAAITNSYCSPTSTSISPTDSLFGEHIIKKTTISQQQLKVLSKTKLLENLNRKHCWMCHEKDIIATLIPCGHTIFCFLCANRLCQQNDACCPLCFTQIYQAIRVH